MNIYLLSGLGADKRVFSNLSFSNKYVVNHIEWIMPDHNEGLNAYARRLSKHFDTSKPFILIGFHLEG